MINVSSAMPIYERDGKETDPVERPTLSVFSHWNRQELIILVFDDLHITVNVRDLKAAIENATNTAKS
jgi:hypothetical protein